MPTKIEWCDETINPFGWGCYGPTGSAENPQPCSYCYAKILARRKLRGCFLCQKFIPHWHPEQLDKPLHWRHPRRIFVQSMGDMFGNWVRWTDMARVLFVCQDCPQHTFYFLTKQPHNLCHLLADVYSQPLLNVWLGATIDTQSRADSSLKPMMEVVHAGWKIFVSIEPLLTAIDPLSVSWADWIIIGSMTGPQAARHQPQLSWITDLIKFADEFKIPIFLKNSVLKLFPDLPHRQEWPND